MTPISYIQTHIHVYMYTQKHTYMCTCTHKNTHTQLLPKEREGKGEKEGF